MKHSLSFPAKLEAGKDIAVWPQTYERLALRLQFDHWPALNKE